MNPNPSGVENPSGVDVEKKIPVEVSTVISEPVETGESALENPQKAEPSVPEVVSQPEKTVATEIPTNDKPPLSEAEVELATKGDIANLQAASEMVEATSFSD